MTDTTSGFRAVNRQALRLFAADYPHDYPEVEATVLLSRHQPADARGARADARPRDRQLVDHALRSVYYMIKVLLALFVGIFRRYPDA